MKLLKLEIENFGKLNGFSIDLDDGVNILCEKNGWGKTTLAVFIKAMLYGLPATTKRGLDRNERKKYAPWQGGAYGGSMEFESEKGRFRVERFFGAKEALDEFHLFDLSTNKPSNAYSANLGVELFGIDADGFERSTYLSQRSIDLSDGASSITTKLTGLLDDVNDIGSYDVAMKAIDKQRQIYEVKGGRGRIADIKAELLTRREELETCHRLLPTQRELTDTVSQIRKQIKETEEALQASRAKETEAKLRVARLEESARMQNRIHEAEARLRELLRAFKEQQIPAENEIAQAQAALSEYRRMQTDLQNAQLSAEETSQQSELQSRYPNGLPSADFLTRVQQEIQALSEAKSELKALGTLTESQELAGFSKTGIPSQASLDQATEALEKAEAADRQLTQTEDTRTPSSKISYKLSLLPLSAGVLLAVLGACISALRLPLLLAGIALVAIGGAWLLIGSRKNQKQIQATQAKKQSERDHARQFVRDLLTQYGVAVTHETDLRTALNTLTISARAAHQEALRLRRHEETANALNSKISQMQLRLNEFFTRVGFEGFPRDPFGAILKIREDLSLANRLQTKKQSFECLQETLAEALKEKKTTVSEFLSRLIIKTAEGTRPEDRLHQIRALCQEHATLSESIEKLTREKNEFISQNQLSETAAPPSVEAIQRQITEAEARLQALRDSEIENKRRLERIAEQTQRLPELEDDVARLSEELTSAQNSLRLLRRTADFLETSKEALSTRYLDGIQEHFTKYRALLEGENTARAVMDTDFNVSVTESGKSRPIESFSRGKRDVLQFCARLALVKAMFTEGEIPFLLLDDPFVNLDEDNLLAARELLNKLSRDFQVLYFICHTGRM